MSSRNFARALLMSTSLCSISVPALAQTSAAPAPVRQSVDANGVDLFLGVPYADTPGPSMGQEQGLSYKWHWRGGGWGDDFNGALYKNGSLMAVSVGATSDTFTISGSTYTNTEGNGATLTLSGSIYTYTLSDGTVVLFDKSLGVASTYYNEGLVTQITRPDGQKLHFNYETQTYCSQTKPHDEEECLNEATMTRLGNVTTNYGYRVDLGYVDDFLNYLPPLNSTNWLTRSQSTVHNRAGGSSTPGSNYVYSTSGGYTYLTVTDPQGRDTQYRMSGSGLVGVKLPGSASEDVTYAYTSGRVTSVTTAAGTTTYSASDSAGIRTVTVTDPASHATTYLFEIASQRMKRLTDALSHQTNWDYDTSGRVTRQTMSEGNYVNYTYDSRGNRTETRNVAKSGSGVSDIVTSASYPSTCSTPITCNKPDNTTDALGNVTDYTYDSTHGGVLTATLPAPTTGAVRPQTRYSYTSLQAYYDTGGGSIVASGEPVYRLTGISECQTTSSCSGGSDETKTTISYGPQTTGTGNNLLPVSTTKAAGDGSLSATTAMSYDDVGNLTAVDGPLSGTADTTTLRYDADRERLGVISPDPDGGGSLKRRAVRTSYNAHGIAYETEIGTVNGTSDSDWAAFTSLQQVTTTLDAADRKAKDVATAGGTTYQVKQYSYDAAGRPECTALRMNSSTWSSLPGSACTLATTGSYGPDRITKTTYDNANRPTLVQTAYGVTGVQADEVATTYTDNGKISTVTDAEANKTTYEYDGVDRLLKMRYPSATAGSGTSSTTDYELLTYDAGSNVTADRRRDGNSIGFTYDHLNRLTVKNLPGSEPDVTYTYDNLGRLTGATDANSLSAGFTYDALGRVKTQTGTLGTIGASYDLAGHRTATTWPDSFYVSYDHLVTGEVSAIRENGASSGIGVLATYSYDDLGRRTSLTRGNGTVTNYGFDNMSRLTSLAHDLASTTYDVTTTFAYMPSGQIASQTRTNDAYAWGGAANMNSAYTVNGLNQASNAGGVSVGYDSRGNLSSNGSSSYTYSSENLLTAGPSSASLAYDPLLRLYQTSQSVTTRFQYDGAHMIGEYNTSGVLQKRYVFGPGGDEQLVEYDRNGGGTYTRSWLHSDEHGSVVAISDDSGAKTAINSYDEYGVPAVGNVGRFQYTGQMYIPELGMYSYKARMYQPNLGRFMQTDPVGYGSGMNQYNYVNSDPVNMLDPTGTSVTCADKSHADTAAGCNGHGGVSGVTTDGGPRSGESANPPDGNLHVYCGHGSCGTYDSNGKYHPLPNQEVTINGQTFNPAETLARWAEDNGAGMAVGEMGAGEITISKTGVYFNGWGGNQYTSPIKLKGLLHNVGMALSAISLASDVYEWSQGRMSGWKLAENGAITGIGTFGGEPGAAVALGYYLLENFYPGGANQFVIDAATNTLEGGMQMEPYMDWTMQPGGVF